MNLNQITPKNFILALFKRDDGERLLLGAGAYEFNQSLQHFQPNAIDNDIVEKQGTDGQLLAGQVLRSASQPFRGYIGDATMTRSETETARRAFLRFFQTNHHYQVVYILPDGSAIQRQGGYLTEAPSAPESMQRFPEYSVALAFENIHYYSYAENPDGSEAYASDWDIEPSGTQSGGLVWDNLGVEWEPQGATLNAIRGDIYQKTTTGKNLAIAVTGIPKNSNGIIPSYNASTGVISVSGTITNTWANIGEVVACNIPAGTYTLSTDKPATWGRKNIRLTYADNTYVNVRISKDGVSTTGTVTTTATVVSCYVFFDSCTTNTTIEDSFTLQLEAGSTPTSFEPYSGGASPNPDYPQNIQTATGRQALTIGGTAYELNLGKNLFSAGLEVGGWALTVGSALTKNTNNNAYRCTAAIEVQPDTEYAFGINGNAYDGFRVIYADAAGIVLAHEVFTGTINTPNQCHKLVFYSSAMKTDFPDISDINAQLENGGTATSYAAYFTPIELCKLGAAQDKIYKDGDDWKVHKETTKATLASSMSWNTGSFSAQKRIFTATTNIFTSPVVAPADNDTLANILCTHYKVGTTNQLVNGTDGCSIGGTGYLSLRDGSQTSAANFTASLDTDKPDVYAELVTPTDTTITDAGMIAQLDAIEAALAADEGVTITPSGTNLAVIIDKTLNGTGGAVWEPLAGISTTEITNAGLATAMPIWTVTGEADAPSITNETTGQTLTYSGYIPNGQSLIVDCENQTATVAGVDVKNQMTGEWLEILPGTNVITYTGTNISGPCELKWNEVIE